MLGPVQILLSPASETWSPTYETDINRRDDCPLLPEFSVVPNSPHVYPITLCVFPPSIVRWTGVPASGALLASRLVSVLAINAA